MEFGAVTAAAPSAASSEFEAAAAPLRRGAMPRAAHSLRGFTLIEVLVVVFIIGIIATFAVLSLGNREGRALEEEARRVLALLKLAREESIFEAQEMALSVAENGYSFEVFDAEKGWESFDGDAVFRPRTLPEKMALAVKLDAKPVELAVRKPAESEDKSADAQKAAEEAKKRKRKDEDSVRIFLLSSGEMTPFELFLHYEDKDQGFRVRGNGLGELKLEAAEKR